MVHIRELLSKLSSTGVDYVIVGGAAASLHGSTLTPTTLTFVVR
jgi:hypothetical protein